MQAAHTVCRHTAQGLGALAAKKDEMPDCLAGEYLHAWQVEGAGEEARERRNAARSRLAAEEEVAKTPLSTAYARWRNLERVKGEITVGGGGLGHL